MIKTVLVVILLASPLYAGKKYGYQDPKLDDEMDNNYKEHDFPNWVYARGSTATVTYLNVSSLTVNGVNYTASSAADYAKYRRPNLQWVSVTTVDIENNTGTANQTCVLFPDANYRCVTEDTASTSVNRRFIITEAASNSGTKNSGLRTGYAEGASVKYALYAWKVSDNSTDFVVVGDTLAPTQANFSALNTFYGTNSWEFLAYAWNGDGSGNSDILAFDQSGPYMAFRNTMAGAVSTQEGYDIAFTGAATTLTYTYSAAMTGTTGVPPTIKQINWGVSWESVAGNVIAQNSGANRTYISVNANSTIHSTGYWSAASEGVKLSNGPGSSEGMDIYIRGYFDGALAAGVNPQL